MTEEQNKGLHPRDALWQKYRRHENDRGRLYRDDFDALMDEVEREPVTDAVLEDIPNEVCAAGMSAWNDTFGSPYTRYAAIYLAMHAALKGKGASQGAGEFVRVPRTVLLECRNRISSLWEKEKRGAFSDLAMFLGTLDTLLSAASPDEQKAKP